MNGLHIPADAPFTTEQQAWLAGFFAGVAAARGGAEEQAGEASLTVNVLFGSQTGNAEALAADLATAARGHGIAAPLITLDDVTPEALSAMGTVVVITSTYGEGEMPDNAELFWEAFSAESAPRLEGLRFAVLALGDSGYDEFCQAGRLIDLRFEQLGATRLQPRLDGDVDYEEPAASWIGELVSQLAVEAGGSTGAAAVPVPETRRPGWGKKNPYPSRLAVNRLVSAPGSAKEIRHFEFELGDSGIEYAAGDAFGVIPRNDPALVTALLEELGFDAEQEVDGVSLGEHLASRVEIVTPSKELIAAVAAAHPGSDPGLLVARGEKDTLDEWLWGRDLLDVIHDTGYRTELEAFLGLLRPLQHRAYSISSGPAHSPDRIHLTVAAVRYGTDRIHGGVCSTFLSDRLGTDDPVGVFLQPNQSFRLPPSGDTPVIMIGPGTGVAPFRGFLQERAATGATGRNWLFFGDQHRSRDFIYEDELTGWHDDGLLTRLDLAFSRDQAEKIYVQTRMREHGAELYSWLEDGAQLYVCGDASRMAKDVERALHELIASARGRGDDDAADYLAGLKRSKRYLRDVY